MSPSTLDSHAASAALSPTRRLAVVPRPVAPTGCSVCGSRGLCWTDNALPGESPWLDDVVFNRRKVKRGETLYRMGDRFELLYAIRLGSFKTRLLLEDGRSQVTGFHMVGDVLGFDGIGRDVYANDAIALEDSEVCIVPYRRIVDLADSKPELRDQLHRMMILREQGVMALLGAMPASERVIAFLLNLSTRYAARGYSSTRFVLRMTREDIGSYLGLRLETVSRVFALLQQRDLIAVEHNKEIAIRDLPALKKVMADTLQPQPGRASTIAA
jgi:CRP/FNR family transcriptional regulator, anaerobic regulatory protein